MSADLIKQMLTALKTCSESAYRESLPGSGWSQWVHFDREKVAKAITAADAHLRAVPDTPTVDLDRIATLERENAELKVWVARWKQLAETNARMVETDKTLREIDAALQPKEPPNVDV